MVAGARVGLIRCGVVWYHRLTERGECGPGDSVVLVVVLKRRTTQCGGCVCERVLGYGTYGRQGSKRQPLALRGNRCVYN